MNHNITKIDWSMLKAVIFDVDGTLYDQSALHRRMVLALTGYYLMHPWRIWDLKILSDFRREREKRALQSTVDIEKAQYAWGAQVSLVSPERVYGVVQQWIFKIPLKYIRKFRYPGVVEFFEGLRRRGITIVVFSDYPAEEKIAALGLSAQHIFCSTDKNINSLKPNSKGLFVIAETLGFSIDECLLIGDRADRDAECARRAGMKYLILGRNRFGRKNRFQSYWQLNNLD